MTSLRSSGIWVSVAESELLPHAEPGQVFIDLGTTTAHQTRRFAEAFSEKGATLLDVPVSSGPNGIRNGKLHMFAGGCREQFDRCVLLVSVIGDPERIVYYGPNGLGQIVKGINPLAMRLGAAAYLEAVAFRVGNEIEVEAICQAVGGEARWRQHFESIANQVQQGKDNHVYVKFPDLCYFLDEAEHQGYEIPLTRVLYDFCQWAELIVPDNMGRESHPFWHALKCAVRPSGDKTEPSGT